MTAFDIQERIAVTTSGCYLCASLLWPKSVLIKSVTHGPGRIMWDRRRTPLPLCDHHQSEKEWRRDQRQDRLALLGYKIVQFSEPQTGQPGIVRRYTVSLEKGQTR
jgi:hypothetical protein